MIACSGLALEGHDFSTGSESGIRTSAFCPDSDTKRNIYNSTRCSRIINSGEVTISVYTTKLSLVSLAIFVRSQGVRIFVFFYIFSAFVLTQGYKASMMSALTIPIVPKPLGECNRVLRL